MIKYSNLIILLVVFIGIWNSCSADPPPRATTKRPILRRTTLTTPALTTTTSPTTTTTTTTTLEPSKIIPKSTRRPYSFRSYWTTTEKESSTTTDNKVVVSTTEKSIICGEQNGEDYPWIALLEHSNPNGLTKKKTLSKGVLIDKQYVLTTVSSIHNSHPFWVVSGVRLGDYTTWVDLSVERNRSTVVSIDVAEVVLHKKKDIALVKLAHPITFTNSIRPICLPSSDNYNFREMYLPICRRHKRRQPGLTHNHFIRTVSVMPLTPQDCSTLYHRKLAQYSVEEEFCAWDERGDTCSGDLGGPLMAKVDGRFQVVGLSSYVNAKKNFKADDMPGVYTRVGSHLTWINKLLEDNI